MSDPRSGRALIPTEVQWPSARRLQTETDDNTIPEAGCNQIFLLLSLPFVFVIGTSGSRSNQTSSDHVLVAPLTLAPNPNALTNASIDGHHRKSTRFCMLIDSEHGADTRVWWRPRIFSGRPHYLWPYGMEIWSC